ncbi:surface antigen BspA-like [Trichomonas vaginalis G3]|uniref:Surface antigen BspA-like n=1 Tax=Trichomonas vaginalis (strain ATCC PRA-98 / G3) TaxID=412133 RepID=A2GB67_TRIV3|nr:ribonuclease inhibitor domain-containing protein [Trichomonas vaginalis G3]EAX85600.1 surface antigen BspA-like [Trichomonas vaginalis G3]KAI5535917.1 ribonuclease inhibitor domain-containing protein [Trichomonas vaginalis G3]|eukprot:XP_001298530.1 surface antigen BspA-like [Trichomonas vaginalis G3]
MYIGDRAFENTVLNTHISFPSTLIAIYSSAFRNCNRIPSISFSSSTQLQLFESAFQDCDSITYITFNTNPSISIGSDCFNGLSSLNTIQIPNCVSSIESACFANCGLTRIIFENNMITSTILSPSIFKGCESLTSFTIPSNCYSIGSNALSGTSITHLDIPDYVSIFDVYCFAFCSSLRSITIKNSSKLTSIRLGVFRGCSNFETINEFRSENFVCENGALYSSDRIKMHVYPPASKRNYFYLLEGVISIEDSAFIGCANLQAVLLPEKSLVKIGQSSFEGCINLRQITIPSSVVSIGENAFSNCPLLNCGALIQNINNKTFINILKKSGLDISSAKHCSEFSCKANMISKTNHPITVIAVFILM